MAYSLDALSDNCYPGTTVLINKYDIRDEGKLADVEAAVVMARLRMWENAPLCEAFDFDHHKAVHAFLFGDLLYEWAGQVRTVDISKKGTRFCPVIEIEDRAARLFGRLQRHMAFVGLPREEFLDELTDFYCATNDLHPFREGNSRAQRAFLTQLIRHAGFDLNWADVDGDLLMVATIQAAGGVTDLLCRLLDEAVF